MTDLIFEAFDILGTISFAISGAMVAVKKRTDLFGVLFLGILTAVGGGILRDVLLGSFPPRAFVDGRYVAIAAGAALLLFLVARICKAHYIEKENLVDGINNVFDAIGLGVFSVTGVQVAEAAGQGDNLFFAVFLGLVTGIGGGLMRDVTVKEIPFVLKKRIYAVASMLGALCYCLLQRAGMGKSWAAALGMTLVFAVRMLATYFKWNLPKALDPIPEPAPAGGSGIEHAEMQPDEAENVKPR